MTSRIVDALRCEFPGRKPEPLTQIQMRIHVAISESLSDDPKLVSDTLVRLVLGKGKADLPLGMIDELLRGALQLRSQFGTINSKSDTVIHRGLITNAREQFRRLTRRKHCVSYKQLIPRFSSRLFVVPLDENVRWDLVTDCLDNGWDTLWWEMWGRAPSVNYVYPYRSVYGMVNSHRAILRDGRKRIPMFLADWRRLVPRTVSHRRDKSE